MKGKFIYAGIVTVLSVAGSFGQTLRPSATPTPTVTTGGGAKLPNGNTDFASLIKRDNPTLETILAEAEKQTQNYQETFKNLLADEKKTFVNYGKNGESKETTVVESTFLVYQSSKDTKVSSELRNVLKVDGKPVPDSQKRSERLLDEIQKATTLRKELEKIQSDGSRYDKTLEIGGLTLSEALVLSEHLRPYFDFKLSGSENFQGNDVYVIEYQQTKKSPYISLNQKGVDSDEISLDFKLNVPKALKNSDAFLRGKIWIDAKTFQIWREESELTIQAPDPIVLLATTLEYQASIYGILVPKQISVLSNEVKKNLTQYTAVKDTKVTFDYSRFRKTEVDVKIIDDNEE